TRAVPLGDVIGTCAARAREIAPRDEVAVIDGQRVHVGRISRSPRHTGADRLPTRAIPLGHPVGRYAAGAREATACDEIAMVGCQRVHIVVHPAAERPPTAGSAVPLSDAISARVTGAGECTCGN